MLNFQDAVYQNSVLLTHAPPLGWVSFPRKTWVSFNYKSIKGLFQGVDNHPCIKRIIDFPADNTAAVPVNHGRQIQESAPDGDVGNINGPCLVWPVYHRITQEIGAYLGLLHPLRKIHFRIDGINIHLIHITPCFASADLISTGFQLC